MNHPSVYVNQFCYRSSVGVFLKREKKDWLAIMQSNYRKVSPYELKTEQIRAWEDEYNVLRNALSMLPESFQKLEIVFEYVLPKLSGEIANDPGCRADVLLLSKETVVLLEFKQREAYEKYFRAQLLKYRRRIQGRHIQSKGMNKHAILVLTKAPEGFTHTDYRTRICSSDQLANTILTSTDCKAMSSRSVRQWLSSEWLPCKQKKTQAAA